MVYQTATRDAHRRNVLGAREISIDGAQLYAYTGRNDFGARAWLREHRSAEPR